MNSLHWQLINKLKNIEMHKLVIKIKHVIEGLRPAKTYNQIESIKCKCKIIIVTIRANSLSNVQCPSMCRIFSPDLNGNFFLVHRFLRCFFPAFFQYLVMVQTLPFFSLFWPSPGRSWIEGFSWPGVFLLGASGRTGRFFTQLLFHNPHPIINFLFKTLLSNTSLCFYASYKISNNNMSIVIVIFFFFTSFSD